MPLSFENQTLFLKIQTLHIVFSRSTKSVSYHKTARNLNIYAMSHNTTKTVCCLENNWERMFFSLNTVKMFAQCERSIGFQLSSDLLCFTLNCIIPKVNGYGTTCVDYNIHNTN